MLKRSSVEVSTEERRWRKKPSKLRTISPSFFFILIYARLCPYFVPFSTVLFPALIPSLIPFFPILFFFPSLFSGFISFLVFSHFLFIYFLLSPSYTSFLFSHLSSLLFLPSFSPPFISVLSLFFFTHSLTLKGDRSCISPVTALGAEILFVLMIKVISMIFSCPFCFFPQY